MGLDESLSRNVGRWAMRAAEAPAFRRGERHAFFWGMQNGQSPGKKVMGIRVVKTDGSAITPIEAIIRYAGYYLNTIILFLGWLWAIPDGKNQGLHDKIAGTVVIKT